MCIAHEELQPVIDELPLDDLHNLRNQMVHEYVEDPVVLSSALQTGHDFVRHSLSQPTK
jgi:hypothetical protein